MNIYNYIYCEKGITKENFTTDPTHENDTQIEIRKTLEKEVEEKVIDLYRTVVSLNMIGNNIFFDRRKKRHMKLEKVLYKYLKL